MDPVFSSLRSAPWRAFALALLAFAAAGPSCFTALMWSDSDYGMLGSKQRPGFRAVDVGVAPAFARTESEAGLWLVLPAAVAARIGADLPPDARCLALAPQPGGEAERDFVGLLQAHAANAQQWPLRVVVVDEGGTRRWLLVAGEAAATLPSYGEPDELRSWIGDQPVDCVAGAGELVGVDGKPAVAGRDVGAVALSRVEVWGGSSTVGRAAAKLLLTPFTLVLDAVTLPFQLVIVLAS